MRLPLSVLLALLAASTACLAPPLEDAAASEGAFSEGRGGELATAAADLAERLGKDRDRRVFRLPVSESLDERLPSKRYGAWNVAVVSDTSGALVLRGFLFLPENKEAPMGSFVLAIADEKENVVATAAYVPDDTPDARTRTAELLDAITADSTRLAGGSGSKGPTPQNVFGKAVAKVTEVAVKLVAGTGDNAVVAGEREASVAAVARVATNVSKPLWRDFAAIFANPKTVDTYVSRLMAIRTSLGSRKVVLVETSGYCRGNATKAACLEGIAKVTAALDQHLAARSKKIALTLNGYRPDDAAIVLWALEHDVPVVLTVPGGGPVQGTLDFLAQNLDGVSDDIVARLTAFASDPATSKLVTLIPDSEIPFDYASHEIGYFAPRWALADEAFVFEPEGIVRERVVAWLRSFDVLTTVR